MKESVGILIIAKNTDRFLLLHRVNKPITWSMLSGKMDVEGETPIETVRREIGEEINIDPSEVKGITKIGTVSDKKLFHVFIGFLDDELDFNLDTSENDDYGWFTEETLPSPIHKRWKKTFQLIKPLLDLRSDFKRLSQ